MKSLLDFFKKGFESILPQNTFSVALASLADYGNSAFKIFSNLKQKTDEYNKIIFSPDANAAEVLQAAGEKKLAQQDAIRQAEIEATQTAQNIVNQIYADGSAQRQQQLQDDLSALQAERSKELENTNLTKQQQAAINKRFDQKEKQTKLAAWKADQEAKKETAIINGLLAITRTYAEYGFTPPALIAIAAQVAATGVIVAEISSQKPPKFRHGQVDIQPAEYKSYTGQVAIKGPGTKTSDSIPALISAGETVIAANPTAKWKEALTAINNDHFEDYLSQKFKRFVFPHIPDDIVIPSGKSHDIDYDRLALAVAKQTAKEMKGIIPVLYKFQIQWMKTDYILLCKRETQPLNGRIKDFQWINYEF
jgi:hypothetical protein